MQKTTTIHKRVCSDVGVISPDEKRTNGPKVLPVGQMGGSVVPGHKRKSVSAPG